jgi:hypothetical protein
MVQNVWEPPATKGLRVSWLSIIFLDYRLFSGSGWSRQFSHIQTSSVVDLPETSHQVTNMT